MSKVGDGYVMSVYLSITSSLSPDAFDALSFPPSSFDRFSFAGSRPPDNALPLPPSSTVAAACSPGLGFNGVVIYLQHHFKTCTNFQILPKINTENLRQCRRFYNLRAVESRSRVSCKLLSHRHLASDHTFLTRYILR